MAEERECAKCGEECEGLICSPCADKENEDDGDETTDPFPKSETETTPDPPQD